MKKLSSYLLLAALIALPVFASQADASERYRHQKSHSQTGVRKHHSSHRQSMQRRHVNRNYRHEYRESTRRHYRYSRQNRRHYPATITYYENYEPVYYQREYYPPGTVYRSRHGYYPNTYYPRVGGEIIIGGHLGRNTAEVLATGLIIGTLLDD